MFKVVQTEKKARLGVLETAHGIVRTPAFMNVATTGAIRGGISSPELVQLKCQIELCNTYHLHLRPGDGIVREMGGLRRFLTWDRPTLTDSGGFQIYSLAKLRHIEEEGVRFQSHLDGTRLFMGPEESMRIQSNLASTVAMAFDECVENPAPREYVEQSCERTTRWLIRCKTEMERLNALHDTLNQKQLLFGINQGGTYADLRIRHMERIAELDLDGYAVGGLAVGESADEMYRIIDAVEPVIPAEKIRYLMGVGTPVNILEAVRRGIDLFDCVMPSRNGRHGQVFTWAGIRSMYNEKYIRDDAAIDPDCECPACRSHSRAYIRHLLKAEEMLGMRLCVIHNLYFYNSLMERIREAIERCQYEQLYSELSPALGERI